MKRFLLIITALALCASSMYAQELTRANFSIGPRVGLNLSNLNNANNTEAKPGLVAGITSTYSITETSGLTFDVLYSQEGSQADVGAEMQTNLDYLRLALAYNQFFGDLGERFRPKIYVGPSLGFLTSAEAKSGETETDIKGEFNNLDVGLLGGIGFNYRIGARQWLNVDGRYYLGLSDVTESRLPGEDPITNRTFQISVGVAFGFGG